MTPRTPRPLALLCLLALAGCGTAADVRNLGLVHRIDVQQGNVITQDMLAQLRPGMEKSKVRFIMGSPMIVDTFHSDRWDYLYSFQEGKKPREQRRVTLLFKDDRLYRVTGDVRAAEGEIALPERRDSTVAVEGELEKSLFDTVKESVGLGDDAAPPAAEGAAAAAASAASQDDAEDSPAGETRSAEAAPDSGPAGEAGEPEQPAQPDQAEQTVQPSDATEPVPEDPDAPPAAEGAEEESFFDRIMRE